MQSVPARIERFYVWTAAGQTHGRRAGPIAPPSARTPLFCFHQSPNSGQVFDAFLPFVAGERRAYALDSPGYGMSDPVADPQTIEAYARTLAEAVFALEPDGPIDVLGYHTGAAIAVELAIAAASRVRRLVLVSAPMLTAEERSAGAAMPPIAFDEDGQFLLEEWRRSMLWRGPGQSIRSVERTLAEKLRPGVRSLGARAVLSYGFADAFAQVRQPMLIVRVRDDLWNASARAIQARPDARSIEIADRGHGLFDADPERMADITLRFLDADPEEAAA